ncbi:MAG: CinA family protein [Chloroflexi bacterium]|nr:CinA family protein [Chloroflexota bacterium]
MTELSALAANVSELLKERGDTIAVSESSCGGLLSAALVAIPGASAYYVGGAIIYTRVAQAGLLRVPDEAMEGQRASTEYYATLNARTIREIHGTTWALSETGASGPTGNRYGDDAGHACIAVSGPVERAITIETGDSDREGNMWAFAEAAFALLEDCLQETK